MGVDKHHVTMALSDNFVTMWRFINTMTTLLGFTDEEFRELRNKIMDSLHDDNKDRFYSKN